MSRRREGQRGGGGGGSPGIRSFVAVLLPEPLRLRLDAAVAPLRRRATAVSWVRAENFHVTLRFLGAVDAATLGRVEAALMEAAAALAPFRVVVAGFGGFPTPRAARVVWAGITAGAEPLAALHARVEAALAARAGLPAEGRPFHPHVTLGRARAPRGAAGLGEWLEAPAEPVGESLVDAVHLMRSELDPAGARYSVLARAPLGGAASEVV